MPQTKLTKFDVKMARRRVECAVYAFGGTVTRRQSSPQYIKPDTKSIFRVKQDSSSIESSLVKSSSQDGTSGGEDGQSKQKRRLRPRSRQRKYEENLRHQYFEHGDRLSWDVQANLSLTLEGGNTFDEDEIMLKWSGDSHLSEGKQQEQQQLKKNRCKKCGQMKQGHVCPYSSSLQRSIGIMVYPSANAHVADEPGYLAPALCEMNNFISIKSASFESNMDERMKLMEMVAFNGQKGGLQKRQISGGNVAASTMTPYRRKSLLNSSDTICEQNDSKRGSSIDLA